MKLTKGLLLFLIFQNIVAISFGQQNLVYDHYFINPYLYNPSYVAKDGYTELYLNYRRTWAGFAGAPKTATATLQIPINYKIGLGVNFYNDQAGIYRTNTGYLTFAYQVHFGKDFSRVNKLGFGLSAGFTASKLDLDNVSNPDDPAYKVTNASGLQGQFGVNYQFRNLKIGFALPRLLKSRVVTGNAGDSLVSPFQSTITTASYDFHLSPRVSLEPFILYRTEKNLPSQLELLGVLKLDKIAWVGAAYRFDYGAAALLGLNLKEKIKIGYAYEFAPNQVSGIGNGSHEVQLIVRLGKKKKERPRPVVETVADVVEEPEEAEETEEAPIAADTVQAEVQEPVVTQQEPVKPETEEAPIEKQQPENTEQEVARTNAEAAKEETRMEEIPVPKSLDGRALEPGHYVVVGAFRSMQNAKTYNITLKRAGYPSHVAYNPEKGYYIVHMGVTPSLEEAQKLRDVYRQKSRYSFRDTWILTIP